MILNFSILVMVLLITLYLANQGMISSLLALATATFSSILAMALMEPLQGLIASFRPNYARGCTFLLVFLLAFSATRIISDMVVIKNIKLSTLINRIVGGVIGFFTSLVVVGTLVLGLEMLPLPNDLMGFKRFPDDSMQGVDSEGKPIIGEVARGDSVWLSPDHFVLAIYNSASGRSLGGNRAWASTHPDLSVESYGYRNIVPGGSQRTLAPELFSVTETWATSDASQLKNFDISADGKRVVMVRTRIKQQVNAASSADEADSRFRATATQIRLVTDKLHQYYPVGYLDDGKKFTPLTLDRGRLVDDYQKDGQDTVVYEDWIFKIEEGENPAHVEMKQLASADITSVKDKPTPALARALYPAHAWMADLCSVIVTFDPGKAAAIKSAYVYVLKPEAVRGDVNSMLSSAFDKADRITNDMENSANGWTKAGKDGVPSYNDILQPYRYGRGFKNDPDNTPVSWQQLMALILYGESKNNADQNLTHMPEFMADDVVQFWHGLHGDLVIGSSKADDSGKAEVDKLLPGKQVIVYTLSTDHGFYCWVRDVELKPKTHLPLTASASGSQDVVVKVQVP